MVPYLPADLLSSRLIIQGVNAVGTADMAKRILKESGPSGFYRGFSASLLLGVLSSTQWWATYSISRRQLERYTGLHDSHPRLFDMGTGVTTGFFTALCMHPIDTIRTRYPYSLWC